MGIPIIPIAFAVLELGSTWMWTNIEKRQAQRMKSDSSSKSNLSAVPHSALSSMQTPPRFNQQFIRHPAPKSFQTPLRSSLAPTSRTLLSTNNQSVSMLTASVKTSTLPKYRIFLPNLQHNPSIPTIMDCRFPNRRSL